MRPRPPVPSAPQPPQLPGLLSRRRFLALAAAAPFVARAAQAAPPSLAFSPARDLAAWQRELRARLAAILALPSAAERMAVPLAAQLAPDPDAPSDAPYTSQRLLFTAEPGERVPGYLLRPKSSALRRGGRLPVMLCLQGHSPGMHISLGRSTNDAERRSIAGGRDLALQAVARGWAALVIEQRGFGQRAAGRTACNDLALHALHQGRPLTGQRVLDVMRALDFAATQPDLDPTRLACIGNSTGGTVSFYAACIDERLAIAVVSCSFCTFADSWLALPHCACGYLPGILQYADMPDLAGLIAPRRLLIVAGKQDHLARFSGVEQGVAHARQIFTAARAPGHLRLVAGEGGHQFFPDLAWPVIAELAG